MKQPPYYSFPHNSTELFMSNPLSYDGTLADYSAVKPSHIEPAFQAIIETAIRELETLEASVVPTWASAIVGLRAITAPLEHAWGVVGHLMGVRNSDDLRAAHTAVQGDVITFSLRVSQSKPIYQAVKALSTGSAWSSLDRAQQRVVESTIKSAELSGIALEGEKLAQFNKHQATLAATSTQFSNNVLDATKAWHLDVTDPDDMEGMPNSARAAAAAANPDDDATAEAGPWRFTLNIPSFQPLMQHCRNRDLREQGYRAFVTRASSGAQDNQDNIVKLLQTRQKVATLLGMRNHAQVSISSKMAESADDARGLLRKLRTAALPKAVAEHDELTSFARSEMSNPDLVLHQWDVGFWAERMREQKFDLSDDQLRPYFPFPSVLSGLFALVERIFGVSVQAAHGETPVWHDDVGFYRIYDEDKKPIAAFFLDPYSRPENKRGGAWMDVALSRERLPDGSLILPVAYLTCNQTPPVGETPSLMTFREVETLFHEFGHGLQHMLTRVEHKEAAGISNVEWDAVELPSQFMENWCYHAPTLRSFARHFETGAPLPDELFDKLVLAKHYRAGSATMRQLQFGFLDLALHDGFEPTEPASIVALAKTTTTENSVLTPLDEDRALCAFGHIFAGGYAAGYYSYKWAEVLSADAFGAFEEVGLDDATAVAETGRRFRETVLALGGGEHPSEVYRAFRGRDPSPDALLRHSGLC
jgi:oligopeptidase A